MRRFYGSPMLVIMFFTLAWFKDIGEIFIPLLAFFIGYFLLRLVVLFINDMRGRD